jgi:hypothetical protein
MHLRDSSSPTCRAVAPHQTLGLAGARLSRLNRTCNFARFFAAVPNMPLYFFRYLGRR